MSFKVEALASKKKLKQPPGLYVCFFTELWERFNYYGMRALFILYMTNALLFTDKKAYTIYGIYGTMVYITPMLGGYLADRLLGYRYCIIFGGILMAIGEIGLMVQNLFFFYAGLAFLITGNGLLKPNISSILGQLYEPEDPRRTPGFTLFYVGVNIGGFLAPILCGLVGKAFGWHYGFGLAGIGMLIGLTVFVKGGHLLEGKGFAPDPERLRQKVLEFLPKVSLRTVLNIGILIAIPIVAAFFITDITGWVLGIASVLVYGYLIVMAIKSEAKERNRIFALLIFMFFAMTFWSFNEQAGSSLSLFTERDINRHLFDFVIPTAMFQAVNPIIIFILGPVFAMLWKFLGRTGYEPSTPVKFGFGLLQMALGFTIMAHGAAIAHQQGTASMLWLIGGYFFMTTGELCIEPIGISMVTKLAPTSMIGLMMGCWYLSDGAISNFVAARIASFTSVPSSDVHDPKYAAVLYHGVFHDIAIAALIFGLFALVISPWVKRLAGEHKQ